MKKLFTGILFMGFSILALADESKPMTFTLYKPCAGDGVNCTLRILADGKITSDTPKTFSNFLQIYYSLPNVQIYPTISFNSMGGSVFGALVLGAIIRENKMNTEINQSYIKYEPSLSQYHIYKPNVICASACVYAFMGGVRRSIGHGSLVGIHRFSNDGDASSSDMDNAQGLVNILTEYTIQNNVSPGLVKLASSIPSSNIYWLTQTEQKKFNLDNTEVKFSDWQVEFGENNFVRLISYSLIRGGVLYAVSFNKRDMTFTNNFSMVVTIYHSNLAVQGDATQYFSNDKLTFDITDEKGNKIIPLIKSPWVNLIRNTSEQLNNLYFMFTPLTFSKITNSKKLIFTPSSNTPSIYDDFMPSFTIDMEDFKVKSSIL